MPGSSIIVQDPNQPVDIREILFGIIGKTKISQCHCPISKHIDMGMNMEIFCVPDPHFGSIKRFPDPVGHRLYYFCHPTPYLESQSSQVQEIQCLVQRCTLSVICSAVETIYVQPVLTKQSWDFEQQPGTIFQGNDSLRQKPEVRVELQPGIRLLAKRFPCA